MAQASNCCATAMDGQSRLDGMTICGPDLENISLGSRHSKLAPTGSGIQHLHG